jgi:hypothetical protein
MLQLSLCSAHHATTTSRQRLDIVDVRHAGRDPTKTYKLRGRMRAEGDRRWQVLAQTLRAALIKHDLVGLHGPGVLPHGNKSEGWMREGGGNFRAP